MFEAFEFNNAALLQTEQAINEGRHAEAAALLTRLQQHGVADPRVYYLGSVLGSALGSAERALESIDRALQIAPDWARALLQRGTVLLALDRYAEVIATCEKVIDMDPIHRGAAYLAMTAGLQSKSYAVPEKLLLRAHQANPRLVEIWYNLARFYFGRDALRAMHWCEQVLKEHPRHADTHRMMASAYEHLGNKEKAIHHIEIAFAEDPSDEEIVFLREKIFNKTPDHVPAGRVVDLFDKYAEKYDTHLVGVLNYRVPKVVAERIRQAYPELRINVLDLGCGTGLLGVYLGRINGYFVGVDLSQRMVEKAHEHGIYHRFHLADAAETLEATDPEEYEVITANEVLLYVGDPTRVINGAHKVLRSGGRLYATFETAEDNEGDLVLRETERYAHSKRSVREACERAGYTDIVIEEVDLRKSSNDPVKGFLLTATKT